MLIVIFNVWIILNHSKLQWYCVGPWPSYSVKFQIVGLVCEQHCGTVKPLLDVRMSGCQAEVLFSFQMNLQTVCLGCGEIRLEIMITGFPPGNESAWW